MRRAYVGVSTPIAYDRANEFSVTAREAYEHGCSYNGLPYPNPVLECPFGLMLLYDEIWFLSRSLCPKNMQDLPYVRFVLDSNHVDSIMHKYVDYNDPGFKQIDIEEYFQLSQTIPGITSSLNDIPFDWDAAVDDRSEVFMISNQPMFGMVAKIEAVMIDLVHLSHLNVGDIELVTNRFTTPIVERLTSAASAMSTDNASNLASVAELVLLDRIPNYLSIDGPYHKCIEEAREDKYLGDFRNWIASRPRRLSQDDISEVVDAANASFRQLQRDLFDKYLSAKTVYFGTAKTLLYSAIDLLAPGAGIASAVLDTALQGRYAEQVRWQGFLASQEHRSHQGNS
jgi:hypothetical protein